MRTVECMEGKPNIPGLPYQLVKWQPAREDLNKALSYFKGNAKAVIVKSRCGWSIFTTGENIFNPNDMYKGV